MKHLFYLFTISLSTIITHAQNDTIFPNVSASWYTKVWTYDDWGIAYDGYQCEMLNDTVDTLGYSWNSMIDGNSNLVGLVRVDSGKVIYQGINSIGFGLGHAYYGDTLVVMYDFNLEVGDTTSSIEPMILDSITVTTILGVPKRTFHLSGIDIDYDDTWIEGMGSMNGFFRPVMAIFELGIIFCSYNGQYLDSLTMPYSLAYDNPNICEELSVVDFQDEMNILVGQNWIQLETNESTTLTIYSLSGQVVQSNLISSGMNRIDLNELDSGIYIIQVGDFYFNKMVKL